MHRGIILTLIVAGAGMASDRSDGATVFSGVDVQPLATMNAANAEAAFKAELSATSTENFESFPGGTPAASVRPDFPAAGVTNARINADGGGIIDARTMAGMTAALFGQFPTSGYKYLETVIDPSASSNFSIELFQLVDGFGFFGVDIGDVTGSLNVTISNTMSSFSLTTTVPTAPPNVADSSVLFFGIVADSPAEMFDRIDFVGTSTDTDVFAFDDMTVGVIQSSPPTGGGLVPEPTSAMTWTLLLIGAISLRPRRARRV